MTTDPSVLASILGNSDLRDFHDAISGGNIYNQLAPAIGRMPLDSSRWSPATNFGTRLAQSFLASALGNIGSNQVADQMTQAQSILPDLYRDPMNTVLPEDMDPEAGAQLKAAAIVHGYQQQALKAQAMQDIMDHGKQVAADQLFKKAAYQGPDAVANLVRQLSEGSPVAAPISAAIPSIGTTVPANSPLSAVVADPVTATISAKTPSWLDALPKSKIQRISDLSQMDREDPAYLQEVALRSEEDSARQEIDKNPAVAALKTTSTALAKINKLKDLNTATSDIPFTTIFVQGLDGSTVRDGEYQRVEGSNPLFQKYGNQLNAALNGESGLGVKTKRAMVEDLISMQQGLVGESKREALSRLLTATGRGATPQNAISFNPDEYAAMAPKVNPVILDQARSARDQMRALHMDDATIRSQIQIHFPELNNG